jgi:hypothetical protein
VGCERRSFAAAIARHRQIVLRGAQPGSIILMHANGRGYLTAEALRGDRGLGRGFEFVTVSVVAAGDRHPQACYDAPRR